MLIIYEKISLDLSLFLAESICMFFWWELTEIFVRNTKRLPCKNCNLVFVFLIETLTIVLTLIHICNLIRVHIVFSNICVQKHWANMVFPVYNLIDTVDFSVYYSFVFINHLYSHFSVLCFCFPYIFHQ